MDKIKQAEYARNKRNEHRAKGLCATGCGRPLKTKWQCAECSTKASFKNNKLRSKRRIDLISKGICSTDNCGNPLATKWLCRSCQDKCNQYAKNWWKKYPDEKIRKREHNYRYRFSGLRPAVIIRDNNICQVCFNPKYKIVVHHINENPKDNRMDNLICMCRMCHALIERINALRPNMRKFFYWFND